MGSEKGWRQNMNCIAGFFSFPKVEHLIGSPEELTRHGKNRRDTRSGGAA